MPLDPLAAAFLAVEENQEALRGPRGPIGPDGPKGEPGTDGTNGTDGSDGTDGRNGTNGSDGVDGEGITWRGKWRKNATYRPKDAVQFDGSSWIAIVLSQGQKPPTGWNLMAQKGEPGKDGTSTYFGGGSGSGGGGAALSNATPLVEAGLGAPGNGTEASRSNHVHPAAAGGAVDSVNGQTGVVVLTASDVSALGATAAAGGDLSGNYPNPSVVDDSHSHGAGTAPGTTPPSFATPAIVLGTAAAAGAATTVIRSDSTILAFDATVPVTQAFSDAAAAGSAAVAARRDHKHGMPASPAATVTWISIARWGL